MELSRETSKEEPAGGEQSLPARDEVAFEKEREEKDDGRYIIYYAFGDDAEAGEGSGS